MKAERRVNATVLALGLGGTLGLVALFAVSFGNDPHAVPSMMEQQPAPPFTLVDLDGKTWTLDALRGQPIVLNFWSTWCLPCKQEHAVLLDAARRSPGVRFLGVIYSDDPQKCRDYLTRAGAAYPHLIDEGGRTAIDFGVAGVPETFFIDREGTIVHKQVGPVNTPTLAALLQRVGAPR